MSEMAGGGVVAVAAAAVDGGRMPYRDGGSRCCWLSVPAGRADWAVAGSQRASLNGRLESRSIATGSRTPQRRSSEHAAAAAAAAAGRPVRAGTDDGNAAVAAAAAAAVVVDVDATGALATKAVTEQTVSAASEAAASVASAGIAAGAGEPAATAAEPVAPR